MGKVNDMCLSLLRYALLFVLYSFAVILKRERALVALLLLSYGCLMTIKVLWLFLAVQGWAAVCDCGIS